MSKHLLTLSSGDQVYFYDKSIVMYFQGKRKVLSTSLYNGGYHEDYVAVYKVNNIFDKFYAEHSNARYNWSSDPDGQWWRAPGRSFLVGMEYAF